MSWFQLSTFLQIAISYISGVARIISGGTPGPLKSYHASPAGCPGAKAPRTVARFHFLKRFKVLEKEYIFQKYQHFSSPKKSIFSKKYFEKFNILQ